MRRLVVLSTNNNPHYFFYAPIVEWCWNKLGWECALFATDDCKDIRVYFQGIRKSIGRPINNSFYTIPHIEGVRSNTLAQTVRHFVADVLPKDCYWQVNDIDLIPLAPWEPDLNARTIYGWELTGKSFIPVHYTGMTGDKWYELMDCTGDLKADMEREMKANGRAYSEDWHQYWDTDWDILTQKVKKRIHEFTFIPREMVSLAKTQGGVPGTNSALTAKGRIDRYNYRDTMNQPNWIDMHCENDNSAAPDKWEIVREVLVKVFGEIPARMDEYVKSHHAKYGK